MRRPQSALVVALVVLASAGLISGVLAQSGSSSSSGSSVASCSSTTTFSRLLSSASGCDAVCAVDELCVVVNTSEGSGNSSSLTEICSGATVGVDCTQVSASDASSVACEYVCVAPAATEFVLLVEFGNYESEEERALRARNGNELVDSVLASLSDDSSMHSTFSNDVVTSVGQLSLGSTVSTLYVLTYVCCACRTMD